MNGRFDDVAELGIDLCPPGALRFKHRVSFGIEVGSVVLPIKPKFDVGSPSIIVASIQLVSGERGTDVVGEN